MVIKVDKLTEQYTLRITPQIKHGTEKMSQEQKLTMNNEIRLIMAKHIHLATFNPAIYFGEDEG